jgi:predicted N-acetyltransferase YhbS
MNFSSEYMGVDEEILDLFTSAFTASEGAAEGRLIGTLVRNFFATTPEKDLFVFTAWEDGSLVGGIVFSRLTYPEDDREVFVLAPVSVATDRQKEGIGQKLLTHGLNELRKRGVNVAVTYGDPGYYSKVGFMPITETEARPPRSLSHPHGWLAQSLTDPTLDPLRGPSHCVDALDRPEYW